MKYIKIFEDVDIPVEEMYSMMKKFLDDFAEYLRKMNLEDEDTIIVYEDENPEWWNHWDVRYYIDYCENMVLSIIGGYNENLGRNNVKIEFNRLYLIPEYILDFIKLALDKYCEKIKDDNAVNLIYNTDISNLNKILEEIEIFITAKKYNL